MSAIMNGAGYGTLLTKLKTRISIGSNSVVGAGSVVMKDVPEGCVVAVVPENILRAVQ